MMRCLACECVYLEPRLPRLAVLEQPSTGPDPEIAAVAKRIQGTIDAGFSFLRIDGTSGLERRQASGERFDRILLVQSIECAEVPVDLVRKAAGMLTTHGRLTVLGNNTASSSYRVFGGRHWSGYLPTDARQFICARTVSTLATLVGLQSGSVRTEFAPAVWLHSLKRQLDDWGGGRFVKAVFTGAWLLPWLVAAVFEGVAWARGKGAIVAVELSRNLAQEEGAKREK